VTGGVKCIPRTILDRISWQRMARQVRIQFQGAVYHVMARGDRRENIIGGDKDRRMFIETLDEACEKTGWLVHAWILMSNHYHLVTF
jgi:putative transposase